MRLIDADALERDGWKMSRTVRVDKDTMEIQTRKPTDFSAIIELFDGEIVNKAVVKGVEYYKPTSIRNFVESVKACSDCQEFDCYGCEHKEESK